MRKSSSAPSLVSLSDSCVSLRSPCHAARTEFCKAVPPPQHHASPLLARPQVSTSSGGACSSFAPSPLRHHTPVSRSISATALLDGLASVLYNDAAAAIGRLGDEVALESSMHVPSVNAGPCFAQYGLPSSALHMVPSPPVHSASDKPESEASSLSARVKEVAVAAASGEGLVEPAGGGWRVEAASGGGGPEEELSPSAMRGLAACLAAPFDEEDLNNAARQRASQQAVASAGNRSFLEAHAVSSDDLIQRVVERSSKWLSHVRRRKRKQFVQALLRALLQSESLVPPDGPSGADPTVDPAQSSLPQAPAMAATAGTPPPSNAVWRSSPLPPAARIAALLAGVWCQDAPALSSTHAGKEQEEQQEDEVGAGRALMTLPTPGGRPGTGRQLHCGLLLAPPLPVVRDGGGGGDGMAV